MFRKGNKSKLGYSKPGLEAKVSPSAVDIAWAAGIYEGEGWCTGPHHSKQRTTKAQVVQKDPWLLYELKALFGGSVTKRKDRDCWDWRVSGTRGRGFLMTIFTFLSPRRREQVRKALQ